MNRICMEPFGNAGFPQVVFICSCNCIFFLPVSPHNLFVLFFYDRFKNFYDRFMRLSFA